MPVHGPGYSIIMRIAAPPSATAAGELTTAVGHAGGVITAVDVVESTAGQHVVDLSANGTSAVHADEITAAVNNPAGCRVRKVSDRAFLVHLGGKVEVTSEVPLRNRDDLSRAYTPGVARVCQAIADHPSDSRSLTIKRNMAAVVTDGTAVLGLGNIGPAAALAVMAGKAALQRPKDLVAVDIAGIVHRRRTGMDPNLAQVAGVTNAAGLVGTVHDAIAGADVIIGVSAPNVIDGNDVAAMNPGAVVFALANPDPEIDPIRAQAHAAVVATWRSDFPNQINNVLAFPGVFRGMLDAQASEITDEVLVAAVEAIADVVSPDQLNASYIVPSVFDESVSHAVSRAVVAASRTRVHPGGRAKEPAMQ